MDRLFIALITALVSWIVFSFYKDYKPWKKVQLENYNFLSIFNPDLDTFGVYLDVVCNRIDMSKYPKGQLFIITADYFDKLKEHENKLYHYSFKPLEIALIKNLIIECSSIHLGSQNTDSDFDWTDIDKRFSDGRKELTKIIEQYTKSEMKTFLSESDSIFEFFFHWLIKEFNYLITLPGKLRSNPNANEKEHVVPNRIQDEN